MVARKSTNPFSNTCLSPDTSMMYVYKIFAYKLVCWKKEKKQNLVHKTIIKLINNTQYTFIL